MVYLLNRAQETDEGLIGRDIADLLHLHRGGLSVVNTIVITNESFKRYAEDRILDDRLMAQIFKRLQSVYFSTCKEVYVQVSTPMKCPGLFDKFKIRNTKTSVRYAIEKIYRTWFEEEARSYRITRELGQEDTAPAIYIQPCFAQVLSLDTRTRITGEPTNRENYTDDIDNVVDYFHRRDSAFLAKIDSIFLRPSLVYFVRDTENRICRVDDELMTPAAYFNAITDYFKTGLIDQVEYLMHITPEMVSANINWHLDKDIVINGEGAGAPYAGAGILIFRTTNLDEAPNQPFVLAIQYPQPEDIGLLYKCVGVIAIGGSGTDHVAVVLSGAGIPLVIANDCIVLEDSKVLKTPYRELKEFTPMIVNGIDGSIATYTHHPDVNEYSSTSVKDLLQIIDSLAQPAAFSQLPLDVQYQIAKLKYTLRQARLIE